MCCEVVSHGRVRKDSLISQYCTLQSRSLSLSFHDIIAIGSNEHWDVRTNVLKTQLEELFLINFRVHFIQCL